jgi:hypothetical protein
MLADMSLKEAEQKVFRTRFQDGLADIFIGCLVLIFAIAPTLSVKLGDFWSSAVFLPFWALVYTGIWLAKKYVVEPRIGPFKFGPRRKEKMKKFTTLMLIVNVISVVLGAIFAKYFHYTPALLYTLIFGFIVMIFSGIAAVYLECFRFFVYGFLVLLALFTGEMLFVFYRVPHHGYPITFGTSAGIILLTGFVLFYQLLQKYPLPKKKG